MTMHFRPTMAKRMGLGALAGLAALAVQTAPAQTVAYWDFEDGVDGQEFTPAEAELGSGGSVDTVNSILMRGYNEQYGPAWTANTADGAGLAMNLQLNDGPNTSSDGYVTEGALHNWSPTAWTIETHAMLRSLGGWNSLIGRDGSSASVAESDFYLQNNGIDDQYRINFLTTGGARWVLDAAPAEGIQANAWYAIAVRSDGQTLSMWMDDGFGSGYQQVGTLDMSSQTAANNALVGSELAWTFGRGWYNGGNVDHINGVMDNVRFTEGALDPSEFLPFEVGSTLTLVVNPDTGEASLRNDTNEAFGFDYYRIDSDAGDLSTAGWNSLSDQGVDAVGPNPGESWDEATGANSANLLVEQFLSGESVLAPGQSLSLGSPYAGSGEGDLEVRYARTGAGLQRSKVVYSTIELPGDFNGDGSVNAADYTVWRDNEGSTSSLAADASGNGRIDRADYNIWAANYGATLSSSAAIPEPAAALLASLGVAALVGGRSHRG
ncbi:LamG-like jellyroll fold domain-containing protein [Botrimarina mediterranea]|uniref:LamG-like jellyroll fold domain-containing protein n=1 Tax=Botrimarina mediterranea TaxID=2528022 RepID=A0A518K7U4_9BACT|nr:dockerin type I domain-containing protein [Botrimarina mediterranea]QDV73874.1 hypothetical protein Spa11_20730 [Botrimarina mediterranea]QDV78504.1 hypothetical protein K2D_21110 [Planctomycetes bacterium K2D]